HEAEIEVEEGGEQGWRVSGLEEFTGEHMGLDRLRVCESEAAAPRATDRIGAVLWQPRTPLFVGLS
ncbi:MAG: hypothetical protein KAG62_06040, partial [Caulobacter sp.]|nr:hypothetical protein [Caulobacter sp.]